MTIKLLQVGKTDDEGLKSLISIFTKRLNHYIKFESEFIPDLKKSKNFSAEEQNSKEGKLILGKIKTSDHVILLDEKGKQFSSEAFSSYLQKKLNTGKKQIIFVIGGPFGFSEAVYSRANGMLSLSKMTFSHQMIRLLFVEQLYRAFTILNNEPYHHK